MMGAGFYGNFGQTKGARKHKTPSLPPNESQLKHIFGNREGHLPDTPENRDALVNLARDTSKRIGRDRYGNIWHAEIREDGSQLWVRFRGNLINEGGRNETPRSWDDESGLNNNPFKGRRKK